MYGSDDVVPDIVELVKKQPRFAVSAAFALAKIGGDSALKAIDSFLSDETLAERGEKMSDGWATRTQTVGELLKEAVLECTKTSVGLSCTISSDKVTYQVGEVPKISVSIRNNRRQDVFLVGSLDGSDCKWRYPYCYFSIKGPDGKLVPTGYGRCGLMNALRAENFIRVAPKKTFDPYMRIDFGFFPCYQIRKETFSQPGAYELAFVYSTECNDINKWLGSAADFWKKNKYPVLMKLFERVPKLTLESSEIAIRVVRERVEGTKGQPGGPQMAGTAEGSPDLTAAQPAKLTLADSHLREGVWVSRSLRDILGRANDTAIRLHREGGNWLITTAWVDYAERHAEPVVLSVAGPLPVTVEGHTMEFGHRNNLRRQTFRFDGDDLVTPAVIQAGKNSWYIEYSILHDGRGQSSEGPIHCRLEWQLDHDPADVEQGTGEVILTQEPSRHVSRNKITYRSSWYRPAPPPYPGGFRVIRFYHRNGGWGRLEYRRRGLELRQAPFGAYQVRHVPTASLGEPDRAFFDKILTESGAEDFPRENLGGSVK